MCYSFESSIKAWIISFLLSTYMLVNPEKYDNWLPLMILTFTQIQIMEAIIWTSMKGNTEVNEKATKILFFMLWLQPLLNFLIGYTNTNNELLLYGTFFYTLILVYLNMDSRNDRFISTVGPNGHLVWNRYDKNNNKINLMGNNSLGLFYLIGLLLPLFFMRGNIKYIPIVITIATGLFEAYRYTDEFGSMWCHTAVLLSIAPILYVEIPLMLK